MKRFAIAAAAVLLALFVLLLGLAGWGWYELRSSGARVRRAFAADLDRVRPAFLEDQALAQAHRVLGLPGRARDAGPLLNPRLHWEGDPGRVERWLAGLPGRPAPLALDPGLVARLPEDWWNASPAAWRDLDFSWLEALAPCDHWDVEASGPWSAAPAGGLPPTHPLFAELTPWVKLRLAKGIAEGRAGTAAAEVEHLAALLLSTETFPGQAQGLRLLALVEDGLGAAARRGKPALAPPAVPDEAIRRRAYRATLAARAYLAGAAPEPYRQEADRIVVGRCVALNEALRGAVLLAALTGREPGEPVHWLPLDGSVASACRLTWVRRAVAAAPAAPLRPGRCDEGGAAWRAACGAVLALPFMASMDRAIAREVPIQLELANLSPARMYDADPASKDGPAPPR